MQEQYMIVFAGIIVGLLGIFLLVGFTFRGEK